LLYFGINAFFMQLFKIWMHMLDMLITYSIKVQWAHLCTELNILGWSGLLRGGCGGTL
jgi:hypothetical protein